jgi:hypothetical protein
MWCTALPMCTTPIHRYVVQVNVGAGKHACPALLTPPPSTPPAPPLFFFLVTRGGGLPQAGHTQRNQANPTAGGPTTLTHPRSLLACYTVSTILTHPARTILQVLIAPHLDPLGGTSKRPTWRNMLALRPFTHSLSHPPSPGTHAPPPHLLVQGLIAPRVDPRVTQASGQSEDTCCDFSTRSLFDTPPLPPPPYPPLSCRC